MKELENKAENMGLMKSQIVRLAIAEWLGLRDVSLVSRKVQ